jgi:hypothetical protein
MKKLVFVALSVIFAYQLSGQEISQCIKGKVVDIDTEIPLPGATVIILESDPLMGTTTDENGFYSLCGVKPGRYNLKVSYLGFEAAILREVFVGSGKQVSVEVGLKEMSVKLGEVEISAMQDKKNPLNSMAIVSARQINMEEARRFAGGFDDPAHLASSFAGVAENMNSNGIVIRGNAPKGLQWRMEGIEISNPSHFANMTTFGGGGITALSSKVMGHSDFYTAAFPAEYGNALSGIFDIKLRSGNRDEREHSLTAGITGIDFSTEGPFLKGKGSTYIINYRYSLFALLTPIMPENAGLIKYQDLSFKTEFPTKKAGIFSVWGIGGTDYSGTRASETPEEWKYESDQIDGDGRTYMGAIGLTNKLIMGKKSLLTTSAAVSGNGIRINNDILDYDLNRYNYEQIENYTWKYTFASSINHKFGSRHTNKTGFNVDLLFYDIQTRQSPEPGDPMLTYVDENGNSEFLQFYSQSRIELAKDLTLNIGFHAQYFTLNDHITIEPRAGLRWQFLQRHTLSVGYGNHSRLEMLGVYLLQQDFPSGTVQPNLNLDFTKTKHFVLGYDIAINTHMHFKAEAFYQHLFDVPVLQGTSFSMINLEQDWFIDEALVNEGTGDNYGIDLTLEKYMHNGYYYLVTASFFRSVYEGGDGVKRGSRFDKNYVVNLVGGKEWRVGRGHRNNLVSLNGKFSMIGGDRMTPVDDEASLTAKEIVYDYSRAFESRKPNVYYLHFTLNYQKNKKKHASIWSFQLLNILGSPEFFGYKYNYTDATIDPDQQTIIMPNISYTIQF